MGLFGKKKDWNVIAVLFETKAIYRVNGNRGKGSEAVSIRDGAAKHKRTLFWAVFDQKGAFIEGEPMIAAHDGIANEFALGEGEITVRAYAIHSDGIAAFCPVKYNGLAKDCSLHRFARYFIARTRHVPSVAHHRIFC